MTDKPDGRTYFNCTGKDCAHWNTRKCLTCDIYLNFQVPNKPAPNICRYPQEFLEEFANPDPRIKSIFDALTVMPSLHATIILQRHILNMTTGEIATLNRVRKATICQSIKDAQDLLTRLLGTNRNHQ